MAKFSLLEWLLCVQYLSRSHRNGMVGERGAGWGCANITDEQLSDEQNKLHKGFFFPKKKKNAVKCGRHIQL